MIKIWNKLSFSSLLDFVFLFLFLAIVQTKFTFMTKATFLMQAANSVRKYI